ncbi:MAG: zf-HC2 domain-containing protein [candidate division Zixibacteria bacterium]|nr:zf-HC2 domain-containing protein [candidate division Zixibacteria bacterium]
MIHAYELGVLSAEDTERFETHLLNCPFCFAEIKRFEASADILRSDETVKDEIRQSSGSSERNRWREYLWPKRPLILRPAFLLLLILILAYPAYRGLIPSHKSAIGPLQTIVLSPTRATSAPTLCVSLRRDGVISFLYRDADPNVQYRITIKSDDDHEILVVPSFDAFDEYGVGSILFPADLMHSGSYRLEIVPETGDHADDRQVYPFRIE